MERQAIYADLAAEAEWKEGELLHCTLAGLRLNQSLKSEQMACLGCLSFAHLVA